MIELESLSTLVTVDSFQLFRQSFSLSIPFMWAAISWAIVFRLHIQFFDPRADLFSTAKASLLFFIA
jgi:hypothetical protein